ncbi:predicted protein [Lichtheimia corymbifera JMRC:FSU:9682]|uniref:Uncharacterized protein n=1 Tax=Lichtheimia corymbifera JMRC:FSU:9682 TaxID=1263082 RepID=A0A068RPT1_9FUNG|nr:predicted protein [Lichtheimia corymbifera JMRC:FSU:9682]
MLMRRNSCMRRKIFSHHKRQIESIDEAHMVDDIVHTHFNGLERKLVKSDDGTTERLRSQTSIYTLAVLVADARGLNIDDPY